MSSRLAILITLAALAGNAGAETLCHDWSYTRDGVAVTWDWRFAYTKGVLVGWDDAEDGQNNLSEELAWGKKEWAIGGDITAQESACLLKGLAAGYKDAQLFFSIHNE